MKCQSNKFESETGCAQKCGDGEGDDSESSAASLINRRMVGDMVHSLLMWLSLRDVNSRGVQLHAGSDLFFSSKARTRTSKELRFMRSVISDDCVSRYCMANGWTMWSMSLRQ